jgi:hypothetical protein
MANLDELFKTCRDTVDLIAKELPASEDIDKYRVMWSEINMKMHEAFLSDPRKRQRIENILQAAADSLKNQPKDQQVEARDQPAPSSINQGTATKMAILGAVMMRMLDKSK